MSAIRAIFFTGLNATVRRLLCAISQVRPSVVDDFIRNFLIKVGLTRTLDSFNTEWYELQAKGRLGEEYTTKVPDIYLRNEELDEQVRCTVVERFFARLDRAVQ